MRYSVWNSQQRLYDYYESASVPTTTNAPKPQHLSSRTLGATVEQAAWPLPSDARKVGQGELAVGMVAVTAPQRQRALAGDAAPSHLLRGVGYIAAGALAASLIFGKRR